LRRIFHDSQRRRLLAHGRADGKVAPRNLDGAFAPAQGLVLVAGLVLSGCHTRVDGDYQLDLEQTKQCVEQAAAADPEAGKLKEQTIKMLEATRCLPGSTPTAR